MFYCDPFGHTQPENLLNTSDLASDRAFVYCHDQEPVWPDLHAPLLDDVDRRNHDLNHGQGPKHAAIITSELHSDSIAQVCSERNWRPYYYFFHGWAAMDWYRGYDRSFILEPAALRRPQQIYFAPNRIISGPRSHRMIMMYHLLRQGSTRGYYSMPQVCPASHTPLDELMQPFLSRFPDMPTVFAQAGLPVNLPGETGHPMQSCWLDQFDAASDSMVYIVTETVAQGRRLHLTEKVFRPICLAMPFLLVSTQGSLAYLKSYGFQTFEHFWDESYDEEPDDFVRIQKIAGVVAALHAMSDRARHAMWQAMQPIIAHNHNHFYQGAFEQILWHELTGMLHALRQDFAN